MSKLLERFTTLELPDAIDAILLGTDDMEPGSADAALSRYASRLLGELGASRMRDIAVQHDIDARRLSNTDLFWLRFNPEDISADEFSYLMATEGIMNRLRLVEEDLASQNPKQSLFHRSAKVEESDCALADVRIVQAVGNSAPELVDVNTQNPFAGMASYPCRRGGEWDVRTRFAHAVESLRLPYRLLYNFDCNAAEGIFRIDYSMPDPNWMPRSRYVTKKHSWVDASALQAHEAQDYSVRLAALLAAAAFGAGIGIRRVHLVAHRVHLEGNVCLSLVVDRVPFLTSTIPDIEANNPSWVNTMRRRYEGTDFDLDFSLHRAHVPLVQDDRELSSQLKDMLLADKAWELDVLSESLEENWDAIREARADAEEAPMAAIATLENIVAEAESIESNDQGRIPLYCSDVVARVLIAEASTSKRTRYIRYPDNAYAARNLLCDLYLSMGEPERSLKQAQEMISLAPTSTIGYTDAVNAYFEMGRYEDAVPLLETALTLANQQPAIAWIFYRLAFGLWQCGRRVEALSCYVLAAHYGFARSQALFEEMNDLISELACKEAPTVSEAIDQLVDAGISLPWTLPVMSRVADALVALTDERIFGMAASLCMVQGFPTNNRDALVVVGRSMQLNFGPLDDASYST